MLELRKITKNYLSGESMVPALQEIDLSFRESEFVAILGPSGCGKTTLLNIIGGLDQYTTGDLIINGKSTKDFKDNDWDTYRNHSIGFVFQSYNLIPHQTVLQNVELALTLSGVSKTERMERAKSVLEQVGLGDQLNKRPNQMSGGQMQRVAIARALVNNPDILLADEPTGALDSETSIQIMDILKEISKDKLVIMVTHNPELAEKYATRTIRLMDGKIIGDDNPIHDGEAEGKTDMTRQKKPSMSFKTALMLSLNNLLTKKARTILTAFAGSIGIIGIALILSLSNGINTYINRVQEDTLSSYPIQIEAETVDMSSLITSLMGVNTENQEDGHELDAVYSNTVLYQLVNSLNSMEINENNLKAFSEFIQSEDSTLSDYTSAIKYEYDLNFGIYTTDADGNIIHSSAEEIITKAWASMMGLDSADELSDSPMMQNSTGTTGIELWEEMLSGNDGELINDILYEQYDVIYGNWPEAYDEVVLVVDENNEISDMVLYALGLKTENEMEENLDAAANQEELSTESDRWSYEDICNLEFKLILPAEKYQYDTATEKYVDVSNTDTGMSYLYNADSIGTKLKIVGIIRPNGDAVTSMITGSLGYTSALTDHLLEKLNGLDIIKEQQENETIDVINGLPFATEENREPSAEEKKAAITEYISGLDTAERAEIYIGTMSVPTDEYLDLMVSQNMAQVTREYIEEVVMQIYSEEMGVDSVTISEYISGMDDETLFGYFEDMMREQISAEYAASVEEQLGRLSNEQLAMALMSEEFTDDQYVYMYDTYMPPTVSESTYEDNLELLGCVSADSPSAINIYAATFADKDKIAEEISRYNDMVESEEDKISYTDYVALLMSSITTIINAISYVLIAFVGISLVVSSIMIGIITYISVLERTKEIGILRAIGASKRDISRVFNAETLIEGFAAGALGIGATLILLIPINAIIRHLTEIENLNAILPVAGGVILVIISMVLTFIAGLIPSRLAAQKDPVEALRTE